MTNSPDLHLWYFNKVLGLGNPEWCTKIREIREIERYQRPIKPILYWGIDKTTKEKKKEQENINKFKRFQNNSL